MTFAALGHRNFRLMWISLLVSNSSTWMQSVAQDSLVYDLTGRAFDLGLINMAKAIAMISLAFLGGTLADRFDRRKLLITTQLCFAASAFLLALLVDLKLVQVWHVVAVGFFNAAVLAVDQPLRQSMLPDLVPKEHLLNAISLNSITWVGAAAFGPALAGPIISALGMSAGFYLNGLGILAVVFAAVALRLPERAAGKAVPVGNALREGFRHIIGSPTILILVALLTVVSFFAVPYGSLLPVFARQVFGGNYQELGWLRAAPGLGALTGGLMLARLAHSRSRGLLAPLGGMLFGIALILFSLADSIWLGLILLFAAGIALTMMQSVVQTLLQYLATNATRGRIMSLYALCAIGIGPLGSLPLSWVADQYGVGIAVRGGALVAGLFALGVLVFARGRLLIAATES